MTKLIRTMMSVRLPLPPPPPPLLLLNATRFAKDGHQSVSELTCRRTEKTCLSVCQLVCSVWWWSWQLVQPSLADYHWLLPMDRRIPRSKQCRTLALISSITWKRERERESERERERENREHQFQEQTLFFALSLFCSLFLVLFRPFCLLISLQHLSPSATDAVCFACFSFSFPCDNGAEQSQTRHVLLLLLLL